MVLLTREHPEITVGCRVAVLNGRHFPAFAAGDEGVVLRVDAEAQNCEVLFTGRPHAVPVALRHLRVTAYPGEGGRSEMFNDSFLSMAMEEDYTEPAPMRSADAWSAVASLVPSAVEEKVKTEASRYHRTAAQSYSRTYRERSSHSEVPRNRSSMYRASEPEHVSPAEVASLRHALEECVRAIGTCARALDAMHVDGNAFHISQVLYDAADVGMKALSSTSSRYSTSSRVVPSPWEVNGHARSVSPGPSGRSYLCATPPRSSRHPFEDGFAGGSAPSGIPSPYTPGRSYRCSAGAPPGPPPIITMGPPAPWPPAPCGAWHSVHVPSLGPGPPGPPGPCPPISPAFPPTPPTQCSTATFGRSGTPPPTTVTTSFCGSQPPPPQGSQLTPPRGLQPPSLVASTSGAPPGMMLVSGTDSNHNGIPDALERPGMVPLSNGMMLVTGPDANRNGIPDILEQPGSCQHVPPTTTTTSFTIGSGPPTMGGMPPMQGSQHPPGVSHQQHMPPPPPPHGGPPSPSGSSQKLPPTAGQSHPPSGGGYPH
mmetsp:Transcript_60299/g.143675  ORF Transcript_60299/g.143675 Transcript_60299/m.143675 type:complete len:539 (-) Transcript_60299:141-1757(-)